MPPPKIIQQKAQEYLRAERDKTKEVLELFDDLRVRIGDAVSGGEEITIRQFARLSPRIQKVLRGFSSEFLGLLRKNLRAAARLGKDAVVEEITEIEKSVTGKTVRLNLKTADILARVDTLLVSQYESSVARYSEELRGRMARVLSDGVLKRQSIDQVKARLAGERGLVRAEGYKIERIVRTEFNEAYNHSRIQSINESKKVLPDLKKRWDAHLDKRTSDICKDLDEDVVEVHQDFVTEDGLRFQKPPGHPNCRSAVTPWRDSWKHLFFED